MMFICRLRLVLENGQVDLGEPLGVGEDVHLDDLPPLTVTAPTENGRPSRSVTSPAAPLICACRMVSSTRDHMSAWPVTVCAPRTSRDGNAAPPSALFSPRVAREGPWGLCSPPYTGQNYARIAGRTPFRSVSLGRWLNSGRGEGLGTPLRDPYGRPTKALRTESIRACAKPGTIRFPERRQNSERNGPTMTCNGSNSQMGPGMIGWCQSPHKTLTKRADAMP